MTTLDQAAFRPGDGVYVYVNELGADVYGTIQAVYRNAIDVEVAEINIPGYRVFLQCTKFLRAVNR